MASSVQTTHNKQQATDIEMGLNALQNVIRSNRESLAKLQAERDADEARYEALKAERDRMSDDLDAIAERLSEGSTKRGELMRRLDELMQEKTRLEVQRDAAPTSNTLSLVSDGHVNTPLPAADTHSFDADFDDARTTTFAIAAPMRHSEDSLEIDMHPPARAAAPTARSTAHNADAPLDFAVPPAAQAAPPPAATRSKAAQTAPPAVVTQQAPRPAATTQAAPPAAVKNAPQPAGQPRTATQAPPRAAPPPAVGPAEGNNVSEVQRMMTNNTANAEEVAAMRKHPPLRVAPPATTQPMRSNQPRVPLCIDVDLRSDNNLYVGFSENISEGGLFVATYTPRPVGDRLTVEFKLPNSKRTMQCEVEVSWHLEPRDVMAHDKDRVPGMGMRFIDLSAEDRTALNAFIAEREPMFFPG